MRTTLNISIVAILFAGLFTSCKTSQDVATAEPVPAESPKDEIVATAPETDEPAAPIDTLVEREFFASIERTPCYGSCPTYKMIIYSDGFIELEGKRAIDMIGNFTSKITEAQVHNFRIRANRTGFMNLDDKYDGPVSDLPSTTTKIVLNGVEKSVFRRVDYPNSILQFEVLFDDLLKSQKWKKVG